MAAMALAPGCARQGAPPGGPEDRRPPVVIATRPDTFEVVERDLQTVRFVFDERISERVAGGTVSQAVLVSPRTGEVDVDHNRGGLEVSVAGGFQPGLVYRVTLLPVISDLFGNQMRDPFELVFSTGGELVPSAVAGLAWDRVTGRGVEGLQVVAVRAQDSTQYVARTDTSGIYAFRYLPPGGYRVQAFQDRDADDEVDPMEPQGERFVQIHGPDTVVTEIGVLQPDTTAAVLTAADILDSVTLTLRFDEPLAPLSPVAVGNVSLDALAQGDSAGIVRNEEGEVQVDADAPSPEVERVMHEHEYAIWVAQTRDSLTRLDSLDRARADEALAQGDTVRADSLTRGLPRPLPTALGGAAGGRGAAGARTPEGRPQGRPQGPEGPELGPDGRPLPSQRLVVRLDSALVPSQAYQVVATGITNLSEIPLGGGTAVVVRRPPPPPDTAADTDTLAVDSAGAAATAPDSLLAPADTGGAAPDTLPTAPDTVSPPPDTASSLPDTVSPPPDTTSPPPDTVASPAGTRGASRAALAEKRPAPGWPGARPFPRSPAADPRALFPGP